MVSVWKKMLIGKLCSICYNKLEIEMIFCDYLDVQYIWEEMDEKSNCEVTEQLKKDYKGINCEKEIKTF